MASTLVNAPTFASWLDTQLKKLPPGSQLPTEKNLAEAWGRSERTIRRACRPFITQGSLLAIRGKGLFIPGEKMKGNPKATLLVPDRSSESIPHRMASDGLHGLLRDAIARGELRRGDSIPAIKFLCRQYRVAPTTVQKALAQLESEGLAMRAGRRLQVGPRERFFSSTQPKQVHLFGMDGITFQELLRHDKAAPAYRKLESELATQGYSMLYHPENDLAKWGKLWAKQKRFPHGVILAGASSTDSMTRAFDYARNLSGEAGRQKPALLCVGENPKRPIRGLNWYCVGQTFTARARLFARRIIEAGHTEATLYYDENAHLNYQFFEYTRLRGELKALKPDFKFRVFVKIKEGEKVGSGLFDRLFLGFSKPHLESLLDKQGHLTLEAFKHEVDQSLDFTSDFERIPKKRGGLWLFCKSVDAGNAVAWANKKGIEIPRQVALACFEDDAEYLHLGISACIPHWEAIGYLLAHAVIGDIPVQKTSQGFIQAQGLYLARMTTRR